MSLQKWQQPRVKKRRTELGLTVGLKLLRFADLPNDSLTPLANDSVFPPAGDIISPGDTDSVLSHSVMAIALAPREDSHNKAYVAGSPRSHSLRAQTGTTDVLGGIKTLTPLSTTMLSPTTTAVTPAAISARSVLLSTHRANQLSADQLLSWHSDQLPAKGCTPNSHVLSKTRKTLIRRPTHSFLTHKLGRLPRPGFSPDAAERFPQLASIFSKVTRQARPNHSGAKIPLMHGLNINQWETLTAGHHDSLLICHLTYGFPLGFATTDRPSADRLNHPSANRAQQAVQAYIDMEIAHGAITGPFNTPPFSPWFHTSPMLVRGKKDSSQKRVIVDLSWRISRSVNANIPTDVYEGTATSMTLPTPSTLAQAIIQAPPTAHLFSLDLSRAYRQLRVDPQEWPLLGLIWNSQFYFDLSLAFGGRWHAAACQRVTEALQFILAQRGIRVWPYLDDIVGLADDLPTAIQHFAEIRSIMSALGLQEATHKAQPPTQRLVWIGVLFDVQLMTMSIPQSKIEQALESANFWLTQPAIPYRALQQLTGRLAHVTKCCPAGRLFMARLFDGLSGNDLHLPVIITDEIRLDLRWFIQLLPELQGVHLMRFLVTDITLTVDSCLTGAGAVTDSEFYTLHYPAHLLARHLNISLLEMFNVLIAFRLWAHTWRQHNVMVLSDNAAVVATLQAGRAQHPFLRASAREI